MSDPQKPFSASDARRITKRAKRPDPLVTPATVYVIRDANNVHEGTFKLVAALCPSVNPHTLKRRLDTGERDLAVLRKPAQKHTPHHPFNYRTDR